MPEVCSRKDIAGNVLGGGSVDCTGIRTPLEIAERKCKMLRKNTQKYPEFPDKEQNAATFMPKFSKISWAEPYFLWRKAPWKIPVTVPTRTNHIPTQAEAAGEVFLSYPSPIAVAHP